MFSFKLLSIWGSAAIPTVPTKIQWKRKRKEQQKLGAIVGESSAAWTKTSTRNHKNPLAGFFRSLILLGF